MKTNENYETNEKIESVNYVNHENYEKMPVDRIIELSKEIDSQKVADEILRLLISKVEYFIDSQRKTFKIDLVVDSELMPETQKLQNLYRSIPDDDSVVNLEDISTEKLIDNEKFDDEFKKLNDCRRELDKITENVYKNMQGMKDHLELLFKRMIFFYEMVGINDGKPLVRELVGAVKILQFDYESFQVGIKVNAPEFGITDANGVLKKFQGESKEYTIPEGFTIWIEISYKDVALRTSLF